MNQPNRAPDELTAIEMILESRLAELHTMLPGRIESYDPDTVTASVKPLFTPVYLDDDDQEQPTPYPVIQNVPVRFPRGGGFALTWPLKKGDPVWLDVAERSLDRYLETDGKQDHDTGDARKHHMTDVVCYPGGGTRRNPPANAHAENLVIGLEEGVAIHVTPDGKIKLGGAASADPIAKGNEVEARLAAIESWLTTFSITAAPLSGQLPNPTVELFTPDLSDVKSGKVLTDA